RYQQREGERRPGFCSHLRLLSVDSSGRQVMGRIRYSVSMREPQMRSARSPELDSVDWAILELLQVDATLPNKDIAATVGVAPSTCLERIRRMRRNGTIVATRAHVAPSRSEEHTSELQSRFV